MILMASKRREAKYNHQRAQLATENLTRSWRLDPQKMQWAFDRSGQDMVTDPNVKNEMVFNVFLGLITAAIIQTRTEMDRAFAAGEVERRLSDDEVTYASLTIAQGYTHEQWLAWADQFSPAIVEAVAQTRRNLGR
jgi:hypothetical protein